MTRNQLKKALLLAGDILFLYASLYLALGLRYFEIPNKQLWLQHFLPFSLMFLVWILVFFIYNLYNLNLAVRKTAFYRLSLQAFVTAGLISIIYFYLSPLTPITPKTNLVIFFLVFILFFFGWRSFCYILARSYLPKEKVAIIGRPRQTESLIRELRDKPHLGYRISFILDPFSTKEKNIDNIPIFQKAKDLYRLIEKKNIDTVVLTMDPASSEELRDALFSSLGLKINFIGLPRFYENVTGKIPLNAIDKTWFLENLSEGKKNYFDAFKRIYDLIFALLLLILTLPLWLFIALPVKLSDGGPVFFKQVRAGQHGKPFKVVKFRTMSVKDNDHRPTGEKDKRITPVGAFLRKTRLDELPQLINILKGEMSFVGPRPERPELITELKRHIPFYKERMLIKPGLTGWDQISGEYHSPDPKDTFKKLQYDLFYIKNRSVYLDLSIILKTVATVVGKAGR